MTLQSLNRETLVETNRAGLLEDAKCVLGIKCQKQQSLTADECQSAAQGRQYGQEAGKGSTRLVL